MADRRPGWLRRRLLPALACAVVVLLGVAWVAGRESSAGGSDRPTGLDAVRLGPDPGQRVVDYLAALPARLPPPGAPAVPALAQFRDELEPADAVRLLAGVAGVSPVTAVFRVPLARVQTALRFQPLPPVDTADPANALARRFALAQQAARRDAAEQGGRLTGRPAAVARYEAAALAGAAPGTAGAPAPGTAGAAPGPAGGEGQCRCVLAVLVLADRAALTALAGLPEVRAVDAAPEGTPPTGVALAPLLPEQIEVAGPVPDDGPVPAPANPG